MSGAHKGNRPTVLQYVGYAEDGGGILAVIRALGKADEFRSILGVGPGFPPSAGQGLHAWRGPAVMGEQISLSNALRCLRVAWCVRRWLRRRPDRIFHGHSRAGLLVALWLRLFGESRVAASVHCLGRQRWFFRAAARMLGRRVRWLGPAMKRYYQVGDATWSNCLPDCAPLGRFTRATEPRPGGPMRVGCVGALVPVKEWELALRALASLPASANVVVWHAGAEDGSAESAAYARHLRELAADLQVESRIEWHGWLRDVAAFYAGIDLLLVTSRWEAFSVAALEAVAAGVPVIAPEDSGTRDLIDEARAGWLFRSDAPGDLANRLATLATPGGPRELRVNAEALQRFSVPAVAALSGKFYRDILASD